MDHIYLTSNYVGLISLIIFISAYCVVMIEEFTHLRKSKPVIISAALIWGIIALYSSTQSHSMSYDIEKALEHNILEFAEIFLFLLTNILSI